MKIMSSNGHEILIDKEDYDLIKNYTWSAVVSHRCTYATAHVKLGKMNYTKIKMHRLIIGKKCENLLVDHINCNGLDNRKSNLRVVTSKQNAMNRRKRFNSASKYKGVVRHKRDKLWTAVITINGKQKAIGSFKKEKDASKAYILEAKKHFGEYAYKGIY